jgi:hypothetical protein
MPIDPTNRTVLGVSLGVALVLAAGAAAAQQPPPPAGAVAPPQPQMQPQPPPGYGPPPPGYAPPPPGYGPPPGYYGQPPPGYAPPPGYYYYPPAPPPPPDTRQRYSVPMMVSGIVGASAGVILLLAGAAVFSAADRTECICSGGDFCNCNDNSDKKTTGVVLMVSGGVAAAIGIPLIIVGARKVGPKPGGDQKKPEEPEEAKRAPVLMVGARSASLRWRF